MDVKFPENFIWGVATSAAQIESAILEDGKGLSIWDAFSHIPKNITDGSTTADACDSYRFYKRDVELLKRLGVNSYRFSISWSRVLPSGKGEVNEKGLDYYDRLIDELLANDIKPNCTLYHWDLPYELHRLGGWLNRDCVNWFADYANLIYDRLGDRTPYFATINEPIAVYVGYALKAFAPGYGVEAYGKQACHNILVAHGKAVQAFRAKNLKNSKVGVAIDIWNRVPLDTNSAEDVATAERANENAHRYFLNPIIKGKYTDYITAQMQREGTTPKILDGDMHTISEPLDFFGLNCYNRSVVSAKSNVNVAEAIKKNGGQYFSNGQEFYPQAVYDCAKMLREEYGLKIPIFITENGTFSKGDLSADELYDDDFRVQYVKGFLENVARANKDGYGIEGYYLWSLIDNFEWTAGNNYKFGLCSVDKQTKERKFKKSAYFYADIIKNGGFNR